MSLYPPKTLDPTRCAKIVSEPPWYLHSHQCSRKKGHGPEGSFCKQHAKQIAEREQRLAKHTAQWADQ